ncbi:MAG: hypothetical protein JWO80_1443 [Bryobacterales bacterium]|nr:hypothetical protein [Bryobacterales bacterium]
MVVATVQPVALIPLFSQSPAEGELFREQVRTAPSTRARVAEFDPDRAIDRQRRTADGTKSP